MIAVPKIPQMPPKIQPNLPAQFQKFGIFEKNSLWVRALNEVFVQSLFQCCVVAAMPVLSTNSNKNFLKPFVLACSISDLILKYDARSYEMNDTLENWKLTLNRFGMCSCCATFTHSFNS